MKTFGGGVLIWTLKVLGHFVAVSNSGFALSLLSSLLESMAPGRVTWSPLTSQTVSWVTLTLSPPSCGWDDPGPPQQRGQTPFLLSTQCDSQNKREETDSFLFYANMTLSMSWFFLLAT